jgi:hypothetical protein
LVSLSLATFVLGETVLKLIQILYIFHYTVLAKEAKCFSQ